jgi:hypothetical protein
LTIVFYSSTSATHLGLWAHLQQPLATTAGKYNSKPTELNLRTVRAQKDREPSQQKELKHKRVRQRPSS